MTYVEGHIKVSPDGMYAIRTMFDDVEPTAAMAWIRVSTRIGATHCRTSDVETWSDIYTPGAP